MPFKTKEITAAWMLEYRKAHKDYFARKYREFARANRESINARWKKWSRENRHKISANKAIQYAVKTGKITKLSCEICEEIKSEAHHPDYSKKLEVIWLCRKHHKALHRKYRA